MRKYKIEHNNREYTLYTDGVNIEKLKKALYKLRNFLESRNVVITSIKITDSEYIDIETKSPDGIFESFRTCIDSGDISEYNSISWVYWSLQ